MKKVTLIETNLFDETGQYIRIHCPEKNATMNFFTDNETFIIAENDKGVIMRRYYAMDRKCRYPLVTQYQRELVGVLLYGDDIINMAPYVTEDIGVVNVYEQSDTYESVDIRFFKKDYNEKYHEIEEAIERTKIHFIELLEEMAE